MKSMIRNRWNRLVRFHRDETGMESVQVVAIVAVAAIVLIFVKTVLWPKIREWTSGKTNELTGGD